MKKLCVTPHNLACKFQRIARDEAPDVDPDVVQQAFGALYEHLSNDAEGLSMLKHLMNVLTNDGASAMDARYAADSAVVRRGGCAGAFGTRSG
jgi:hypothetical protein